MNSPEPIVSVIIPTYNQADLLHKAVQSVLDQTFQNWEALVIDNYSQDATRETLESFHDRRINHVLFSNKGIIAASRNHGIHLARAETIAFLDSDDLWYPSKLSACLGQMSQGADAVCHGIRIRKDGILQTTLVPAPARQNFYQTLLYHGNSVIVTSAVMVKKDCFNRFGLFSEDPAVVTAEDYELWLRLSKNKIHWECIPDVLGEYTVHGKNASNNVERQMLAEDTVVLAYCTKMAAPSLHERISCRKRRAMIVFRAGVRVWQSGHRCESISYLFKGISRIVFNSHDFFPSFMRERSR
jgi:glycosyltransferase involved in cell wall biosynthesis